MPTTVTASGLTSSRRTMRIRFRTTSSATSSRRRRASSGSPPTTGSTASTWKTTASNASTPPRGQRPHGRAGILGRGRGRRHNFLRRHGVGIACYDKALGWLSALNVPQFNSSEIRAVYYGGQNTLLLHTVQEELVRIRYGLSATGEQEVEKVGLFPKAGSSRCSTAGRRSTWLRPMRKFTATNAATGSWRRWVTSRPVRYALSPNTATITC